MADRHATLQSTGLAVQQDPNNNDAWLNLGIALGTDSIRLDNNVIDRKACFVTCLENDDYYWRAWYNLGMTLGPNDKVVVRQHTYTRDACLVKCLELNDTPLTANAWAILGTSNVSHNTTVSVNDVQYKGVACYVRALELDPSLGRVWQNLALASPSGATVNNKSLTSRECLVKALEQDPALGRAWYSLAVQLYTQRVSSNAPATAIVKGHSYDELNCELNALQHEPQLGHAWSLLGTTLRDTNTTATVDGVTYGPQSAMLRALQCDPNCALAWCNVAPLLNGAETFDIDGHQYNAQTSTVRSLELMSRNPFAWYNLGVTTLEPSLPDDATVKGRTYNANECFLAALQLNDEYGRPWAALGERLKDDDTVELNGASYDRFQCIAKGELYAHAADPTPLPPADPTPSASVIQEEEEL